jgi:hypothetical protein
MHYALCSLADEGMWLPSLVGQQKMDEMRKKGLKLSAEDIYSINQASLKDAIVQFGRGCTGVVVSDEGLILTNHHCGFGSIQRHSAIGHDYLTDGFWAMNRAEELSNPGLTVSFLVRMEDVTEKVNAALRPGMNEKERQDSIASVSKAITAGAVENTHYQAEVRPLFGGNQFFLYVTEVFKDVRLVGAPPSAVGNFGGDSDNWVWPRHTGDFSIFRIYADSNNMPADYSESNRPYKPKKFLEISLEGVDKGDFTMVYGFPGSTRQYLPSFMIDLIANVSNPVRVDIRRQKLDIIGAAMAAEPQVRIQYASKYAGIANAWKKWDGESHGLQQFGGIEKKEAFEKEFSDWAAVNGNGYAGILGDYRMMEEQIRPIQTWIDHFSEAIWSHDIIRYAAGFRKLAGFEKSQKEEFDKELERLRKGVVGFFKDYHQPTDQKLLAAMLGHFRASIEPGELPEIYILIDEKFGGDILLYTDWIYENSFMVSEERVTDFLDSYKPGKTKLITEDPVFTLMQSFFDLYSGRYQSDFQGLNTRLDSIQRLYMKAIMEKDKERMLYPDANSTLRISYGVVKDYYPRDAVYYDYQTTLAGIMEKYDPDSYDYRVPEKLKELYEAKDYGRYGENGEMFVCFTAANHTTGGNSGSPALDAEGRLIGLNFDRNWEGTMSDIMYDPDMCRNIVLDIRYCLFIIDKYAGAGHLVDEMKLVEP